MATSTINEQAQAGTGGWFGDSAATWEVIRAVFAPLASLKLTVALLALAAIQTLLGTLAQDKLDIWEVMTEYFRAWFTWVELRMLFPDAWWPTRPEFPAIPLPGGGSLPLGFPFPGGLLIGSLMALNLFAAHGLRFKIQAKGFRLSAGWVVITLGVLITWLVIASGHNGEGLQGEPHFSMAAVWGVIKISLVIFAALCVLALSGKLPRCELAPSQKIWAGTLCAISLALLAGLMVFNHKLYLGDGKWESLWFLVKMGLAVTAVASATRAGSLLFERKLRKPQLVFASTLCLITGLTSYALFYHSENLYLGDNNVRILWQLIQGGFSAVVVLIGCILVFKQRAGIVVIHSGIALMMLYELFVGTYAVEERMSVFEGQTTNVAHDTRYVDLVITDKNGDDQDKITVVPISSMGIDTPFLKSPRIKHDDLPFDIEIVEYYKNTKSYDNIEKFGYHGRRRKENEKTPADKGYGVSFTVDPRKPVSGADDDSNRATVFVKFYEKDTSKDLGTYLISQTLPAETVRIDGKQYIAELRLKEVRKPYKITLVDVRKDDYIGTPTPRNYSSDIVFNDADRDIEFDHHIRMNKPMRYAGETFYQSGYDRIGSREFTSLQIVKNTGWMAPYVGCMVVLVGMLAHFSGTLGRFLNRTTAERKSVAPKESESSLVPAPSDAGSQSEAIEAVDLPPAGSGKTSSIAAWLVPTVVVLLFAAYLAKAWMPEKTVENAMKLSEFGKQPVVYEGREKPFDTLARDSLRVLSDRETFVGRMPRQQLEQEWDSISEKVQSRWPTIASDDLAKCNGDVAALTALVAKNSKASRYQVDEYIDDLTSEKNTAVKWLLDVISGDEIADEHKVFRIVSLDVLQTFNLDLRKGFRYSYAELEPNLLKFKKQIEQVHDTDEEKRTVYQGRISKLHERLQVYEMLRSTFAVPRDDLSPLTKVELLNRCNSLVGGSFPLSVPTELKATAWETLSVSAIRDWIGQVVKDEKTDEQTLAAKWAGEAMNDTQREDDVNELVDEVILSSYKAGELKEDDTLTAAQLEERAQKIWSEHTKIQREDLRQRGRQFLEESFQERMLGGIAAARMSAVANKELHPVAKSQIDVLTAYRDGKADAFNLAIDEYKQAVAQIPDDVHDAGTMSLEVNYNRTELFYQSMIIYVVALVFTCLGWLTWMLDWHRPFMRTAFSLIFMAFLIHTAGLVARIVISGRPPVTNLYSSAIFIGWACVGAGMIIERIFKLGFGNVLSSVAGFSTLIIAMKLALTESDTMKVLQAVLDTTFWLSTHVVCITLGYAATFLAGLIATIYIVLGLTTTLLARKIQKWTLGKILANMVYGVICFAIFLSFVGTVLGGLWADDSWGRFWGWDPKENGALIIVLWNALVLHARWGGMVKDRGFAILAIGGNIVTSWSWFGVNELGVGLHSYGFTEGVLKSLFTYVFIQIAIIGVALLTRDSGRSSGQKGPSADSA